MATSTATAANHHLFRAHTQPVHLVTPLLEQLCREWTEIHLRPTYVDTVTAWGRHCPALAGLHSPGEIVDHIDAQPGHVKDQVMLALLDLFHGGDDLAGRIILQAMLPGLVHLARRVKAPRGTATGETLQRTITEFWAVISKRKSLPPNAVAGRIKLDTLHQLTEHRRATDVWEDHTTTLDAIYDQNADGTEGPSIRSLPQLEWQDTPRVGQNSFDPDAGLLELLLNARDTNVLTAADAQFLADVYLFSTDMAHAARRLGKQPAAVRQRCARLRKHLIATVLSTTTNDRGLARSA